MEKPAVLKASTPGGHPAIRAVWLGALVLGIAAAGLFALRSFAWPAVALVAAGWLLAGYAAYLIRHARAMARLRRIEALTARGDLAAARALAAPLLDRYPGFPPVRRAAGLVLYASGDPLSAASLLEPVAQADPDPRAVTTLVASYAALNKGGDARRAAARLPDDPDVRLALAWSELVALGGDRARGAALADGLPADTPARAAMRATLRAVAAAQRGDARAARTLLGEAERGSAGLAPDERAFLGYLGGVALRDAGAVEDARRTFTLAMDAAPDTIGEALARRERNHMPSGSGSSSDASQPASD